MEEKQHGTTAFQLLLAWGFVGLPLAWGVAETVAHSLKLFR
jgi:hypothetical protein